MCLSQAPLDTCLDSPLPCQPLSSQFALHGLRALELHLGVGGFAKGWFPKGWFWRMFPGTKNRNEGTSGCSLVPRTGTRVHSDVPRDQNRNEGTLAKTALLRNRFRFLSKVLFCSTFRVKSSGPLLVDIYRISYNLLSHLVSFHQILIIFVKRSQF